MLFFRKIGALLRGNTTPFHVITACLLGAMLGFIPSFANSPALCILFLLLLIVLNANLFLAATIIIFTKGISLIIEAISFDLGYMLHNSPMHGLFRWLANTPVTAWFGFEYYQTSGALLIGAVLGLVAGIIITLVIHSFRTTMAGLEENSKKFKEFTNRKSSRLVMFIFLGSGKGTKQSYQDLTRKKVGNPIRVIGLILVLVICVVVYLNLALFTNGIAHILVKDKLEQLNGATVDIDQVNIDLSESVFEIKGLAMADPSDLGKDLLRVSRATGDISASAFLTKRAVIEDIQCTGASHGQERKSPGRLIKKTKEPDISEQPVEGEGDLSVETVEKYLKEAKEWKERLRKLRDYFPEEAPKEAEGGGAGDTSRDRHEDLKQISKRLGYHNVKNASIVESSPTILIENIFVDSIRTAALKGETLGVKLKSISTQPWLVDSPPSIKVASSAGTFNISFLLGRCSSPNSSNLIRANIRNLKTDDIMAHLKKLKEISLSGGETQLRIAGHISGRDPIDIRMDTVLSDPIVQVRGNEPVKVRKIPLVINIQGTMDNPRIAFNRKDLLEALGSELKGQLKAQIKERAVGKAEELLEKKGSRYVDKVLDGRLGKEQGGGILKDVIGSQDGDDTEKKGLLDKFLRPAPEQEGEKEVREDPAAREAREAIQ